MIGEFQNRLKSGITINLSQAPLSKDIGEADNEFLTMEVTDEEIF